MELVAAKGQVIEGIRTGVEDAPALCLPGTDGDDRVTLPVDPVLQAIRTEERPLPDEEPLRPTGEAGEVVEGALDDDGAGQPTLNLLARVTMDVGMIR